MGLLDFLLPGRRKDAILGTLTRGWGCWRGKVVLDEGQAVPLVLQGWGAAPDSARLHLARELLARYDALRPAIALALFDHYIPYAEAVTSGEAPHLDTLPRLAVPDEVWPYVSVVRVSVERLSGAETVEIAYRAAWDDEHTLGARFQAWTLVELNGSVHA